MSRDEELLAAFLDDRADASFRALYDRHAPAMYALALRLMGGRASDAADALQDSWMRAWPKLAAFRGESSLRTWLCGFVVNCCRERFRGPLFEPLGDDAEGAHLRQGYGGQAHLGQGYGWQAIDLERTLASLSSGYRAVIVLHDIEGYTHREIAAALGIDEGTSKSQLSRGRAALRQRLSGSGVAP